MQQVLVNLCLNARDAMPGGGELVLKTTKTRVEQEHASIYPDSRLGEYAVLAVSDNGVGMDAATLEQIFEPFFTTKEAGKGTGLGLATVYGIVKQHGGFLNVYSEPGSGTTFRIYWPKAKSAAERCTDVSQAASIQGSETLLLAEDNERIRVFAQESLESLGYTVLTAGDGEQAAQVFQRQASRIALVILDVTMPKIGGTEAYQRISAIRPDIPVIFITGYGREAIPLRGMVERGMVVVQKPFTRRQLGQKIRGLLDAQPLFRTTAESA
jgi:CheY-like chemotaxis protein